MIRREHPGDAVPVFEIPVIGPKSTSGKKTGDKKHWKNWWHGIISMTKLSSCKPSLLKTTLGWISVGMTAGPTFSRRQ